MSLQEFPDFDRAVADRLETAVDELAVELEGIATRDQIAEVVRESARQLRSGNVAAFVPVLARRFARERLRAHAQSEGRLAKHATEVVFVSLTGGGRAQIAAALLSRGTGGAVEVHTAGSGIVDAVDPNVVAAMGEIGIDVSAEFTRPLTPEVLAAADVVVTMGRSVGAIDVPAGTRHLDWRVGDPSGAGIDEVRRVRDDIERRVETLAETLLAEHEHTAS
jgi:protein-tyrosine-phosphatase